MSRQSPAIPFGSPKQVLDACLHGTTTITSVQLSNSRKHLQQKHAITLIVPVTAQSKTPYARLHGYLQLMKDYFYLTITGELDQNDMKDVWAEPMKLSWNMNSLAGFSLGSESSILSMNYYEEQEQRGKQDNGDNCLSLEFVDDFNLSPRLSGPEGYKCLTVLTQNSEIMTHLVLLFSNFCDERAMVLTKNETDPYFQPDTTLDTSMALHAVQEQLNDVTLNNINTDNFPSVPLMTSRTRPSHRFSFKPATVNQQHGHQHHQQQQQLIHTLQEQNKKYQKEQKRLQVQLETAQLEANNVKYDLSETKKTVGLNDDMIKRQFNDISNKMTELRKNHQLQVQTVSDALTIQYQKNKQLLNALIESQGNIRVFVRVRPLLQHEIVNYKGDQSKLCAVKTTSELQNLPTDTSSTSTTRLIHGQKEDPSSILAKEMSQYTVSVTDHDKPNQLPQDYPFEQVFDQDTSQEEVVKQVLPFVISVADGYNVCVCAYGQTGSGKTYTMGSENGVNYTAITHLFTTLQERQQHLASCGVKHTFSVEVSAIEIYNEVAKDLLGKETLDISFLNNSASIKGLKSLSMRSVEEVRDTLENKAYPNRTVAATNMNSVSSRSHCLIFVNVKNIYQDLQRGGQPEVVTSRLVLIDLAGSERPAKSGVQGAGLTEAIHINKSLSTFGTVLHALQSGAKHIPYRDSKLTMLLADCLSGDSKVLMFCNISPASFNAVETNSSLMFAQRAQKTGLGKATKNVTTEKAPAAPPSQPTAPKGPSPKELELQEQIRQLQQQMQQRDQKITRLENDLKNSTFSTSMTTTTTTTRKAPSSALAPTTNKRTTISSGPISNNRPTLSRQESSDNNANRLVQLSDISEEPNIPSSSSSGSKSMIDDLEEIVSNQPRPITAKKRKSKDRTDDEIRADETPTHIPKLQRTAVGMGTPSKSKSTTTITTTAAFSSTNRTTLSSIPKPLASTTSSLTNNRTTMSTTNKVLVPNTNPPGTLRSRTTMSNSAPTTSIMRTTLSSSMAGVKKPSGTPKKSAPK